MCELNETGSFLETYKDLINIIVGIIGGIFLSTLTFLLTYRNNWRNKLTRELTVTLKFNKKETEGNHVKQINLRYEINNTTGNELSINSAYIELPKDVRGTEWTDGTYGERLLGTGRYYLFQTSKEMRHHLSGEAVITEKETLDGLAKQNIMRLRLIVNTSRYGRIKSNFLDCENAL